MPNAQRHGKGQFIDPGYGTTTPWNEQGTVGGLDIKNVNAPGLGEPLSDVLLHISRSFIIPVTMTTVTTSGHTGYTQGMIYPSDAKKVLLVFHNVDDALKAAGGLESCKAVIRPR
ncbi:Hypothetical predicted protein [Lecanosticta acicola]|uniref:Uncharacterized protein n=1 Tax=Lecanosticta acicola TaxID=111012 RepID=A0AAI8YTA6_9PEZI|nr:Hypothetical predicted protein [Lecanosticta acicola]